MTGDRSPNQRIWTCFLKKLCKKLFFYDEELMLHCYHIRYSFIFAQMLVRRFISVFLIAVYTIIVGHDLMPHHHHHTNTCQVHDYSGVDSHHSDCDHSNTCKFPFHQHSLDEAGVFLNNPSVELNFGNINISPKNLFDYSDVILHSCDKTLFEYIPPVYKGPELTSFSLRGPRLS